RCDFMPASKDDVVRTIHEWQREIEQVASSLPDAAWSRGVYEQGWNAKQLFCHLSESSGVASFLIGMAGAPARAGGGAIDIDDWNAQRVSALQDKPLSALLDHLRGSCERDIAAVQAAPDDLLSREIQTPWGAQGPLADIIVQSIREHGGMHLADLRAAAG
ncbi:MAG TPA: maleylpyruvate isomerase N-terminal domain-containing protein, partial [Dehalococcoidia bacterium]|nr:maleylpyruvate isomerase N-terminal domain-containing protein [Dehalococcoidia bacterium]